MKARGDEALVAIFDGNGWGQALKANDIDQQEMASVLKEGLDSPDINVKLKSLGMIYRISRDIAEASGILSKERATLHGEDPERGQYSVVRERTVANLQQGRSYEEEAPGAIPDEIYPAIDADGSVGDDEGAGDAGSETGSDPCSTGWGDDSGSDDH